MTPAAAVPEPEPHGPGELFRAEVREQPEALLRLLEHEADFASVSRALVDRAPSIVRLVGHGSSDAAASYGVYALGLLPAWTAMRDSISLSVYYDAKLDLSESVVVALSQSGETPDVVEYVARARSRGALTVAVTNAPESELGRAADAAARVREAGASVVASGNAADAIEGAAFALPVPEAPHSILAPLLSVVPGQLFAAALAQAKGFDADYPAGLSKVTRAR